MWTGRADIQVKRTMALDAVEGDTHSSSLFERLDLLTLERMGVLR